MEATHHKPAGSKWTDEQWAAIAAEGTNILVAAAAGSGKTAVLVERIISRIADEERPLDVDALLVATFTKAAAAEMKERIRIALEDELEKRPDSAHLRRQLALLPRASITTLHSFCMEVIEKYAPLIGLDPGFRIANETEAELLRMDTLDALFEERYEAEGEQGTLAGLADRFGGERSDEPLHRLVLELHDFAGSHPWPEWWLKETAARFKVADADELSRSEWVDSMRKDVLLSLEGALQLLDTGIGIADSPGGPVPYGATLADDRRLIASLLDAVAGEPWESWNAAFAAAQFGRLKPCRGDDYDPELQERVKGLRDEVKKTVSRLAEEWFVRTPEQYAAELRRMAPDMAALAELAAAFGERYEAAKRGKGLLDFGDLEHYALRILRDPASTPERSVPSAAALDYRNRFAEILLDEYQDTNEVQEAIVSLIARHSPGNVFMVGDVKQSIYRFRLAEPGLFLAKYKSYDVWTATGGSTSADEPAAAERTSASVAASASGGAGDGLRIDLARNFRSRPRVVDAVNHVFRLILREKVGEMNYDRRAELVYGEGYPAEAQSESGVLPASSPYATELILIDAGAKVEAGAPEGGAAAESGDSETEPDAAGMEAAEAELESAQLEARCIAAEIKRLMGQDGSGAEPFAVYDGRSKMYRPLAYRDIVILLRAATSLAPSVLEEFKAAGIPAYAELATGYFAATEVDVMLSLLHLIDNPDQDIPLAGVLRSPLVGLDAEQLALIRLRRRQGSYWQAVCAAASEASNEARAIVDTQAGTPADAMDPAEAAPLDRQLADRLRAFLAKLESWRSFARREPIGELLNKLYRDTGYYDFVGGLPGGIQRQANLRALVDRARQFERNATSRGLFRFLRFLGRMRDTGSDLGAARALGEQEDVVRVVSIHKSKGLEFPVVFAAGLGRGFNKQDLNGLFLKHKKLGFGPKIVDPETRVAYPSLPQLAIRRRLKAEMLAEEMRVLYVALTRPKEKLILVGTTKNAEKDLNKWRELAETGGDGLPDYAIAAANRYLDWVGPAAALTGAEWDLREAGGAAAADEAAVASAAAAAPSTGGSSSASPYSTPRWRCRVLPASVLTQGSQEPETQQDSGDTLWNLALQLSPVSVTETAAGLRAYEALSWQDPNAEASRLAAKTSITALKRQQAEREAAERARPTHAGAGGMGMVESSVPPIESEPEWDEAERTTRFDTEELPETASRTFRLRRPRFLGDKKLTPAERGTVVHLAMQHLPIKPGTDIGEVEEMLNQLVERRIWSAEQRQSVAAEAIAAFCRTELYSRMCAARTVWREIPFSYGIPAGDAYSDAGAAAEEIVLIQGVIDCLFPEEDGLVLVDYKTDRVPLGNWEEAAENHRFQIERYAKAIGDILGQRVKEGYIYFIEGERTVRLL
ncbi:UvrD-helicase domain-containing protein [Cohnella lubricantis]|uniref:ATP-dependent helicase/nuclease subunit A n=2 Tax=Cohnella lubricantis TaxID=2163172 RepID=A0A841THN5_9BACL|nr:UvrD-helicase domain-containing protein [Cohnella lubricantis]